MKVINAVGGRFLQRYQGRKGLCEEVMFELKPEEPAGERLEGRDLWAPGITMANAPGGDELGGVKRQSLYWGGMSGDRRPGGEGQCHLSGKLPDGLSRAGRWTHLWVSLTHPRHVRAGAAGDEEAEGGGGQTAR